MALVLYKSVRYYYFQHIEIYRNMLRPTALRHTKCWWLSAEAPI